MAIATPKRRVQLDLFDPTPEPTPHAWVESYWVKRPSGKGEVAGGGFPRHTRHEYFRFCYLEEPGNIRSVVRHHIPGGNTCSGVAQARAATIKLAIRCGDSVSAIAARIKAWKAQKSPQGVDNSPPINRGDSSLIPVVEEVLQAEIPRFHCTREHSFHGLHHFWRGLPRVPNTGVSCAKPQIL